MQQKTSDRGDVTIIVAHFDCYSAKNVKTCLRCLRKLVFGR